MQKNYKKEEKIKKDSHFYTLILTNYVYSEDDRANKLSVITVIVLITVVITSLLNSLP